MTNAERKDHLTKALALQSVPSVGRITFGRLIKQIGSVEAVFAAERHELETVRSVSTEIASSILNKVDFDAAAKTAAQIISLGWEILYPDLDDYPQPLAQIYDLPQILYRSGRSWSPSDRMIAIVGTRHATGAGMRFTHQLAADLAEAGIIVVSGMAEGVDSAAHRGALSKGGTTVAVWGRPLNVVYPECNKELAEEIKQVGTIYSEYPPDSPYMPGNFPERNRIIAGLCEGVVIVEAGQKSGALITAQYALEQGRELFAVPGGPTEKNSYGCNALIKSGVKLITTVQDIFDELPTLVGQVKARKFSKIPEMSEREKEVVNLLATGPLQIDEMSTAADISISEAMELLLALELKGVVQELSGKRFVLAG